METLGYQQTLSNPNHVLKPYYNSVYGLWWIVVDTRQFYFNPDFDPHGLAKLPLVILARRSKADTIDTYYSCYVDRADISMSDVDHYRKLIGLYADII